MKWFLKCLKQYADFRGRARRKEYWMFYLFYYIIGLLLALPIVISDGEMVAAGIPLMIFAFAIIVPGLAVTARRLHDTNRSAWWMLVTLIPYIGSLWLFVLTVLDSHPDTNEWCPNPKAGEEEC